MDSGHATELTSRFAVAVEYVAQLQTRTKRRRKGKTVPYLAHLLGVTSLVLEAGGNEDESIAALFHDTVEDQWTTLEDIRRRFGEAVARIVDGCTDTDQYPKPPWKPRKAKYIENLRRAPSDVLLVSLADKLYNAKSTLIDLQERGDEFWTSFNAGRDDHLWYYQSLIQVYRANIRTRNWMLSELEDTVKKINAL